jgi:hypothetical protein
MKHDPLSDLFDFLTKADWPTPLYWLLLLGSIGIAVHVFRRSSDQRTLEHVGNWAFRLVIGSMWWQQTLWKLPPQYGGLRYWVEQEGKSAFLTLQADFVNNFVLPNFLLVAPIVYVMEALTGASLMLGVGVRLWGIIGVLQIVNLWLGLYNAQGEWPWTYFFLIVLQLIFALHRYGRSLGIDAIIAERAAAMPPKTVLGSLLLEVAT